MNSITKRRKIVHKEVDLVVICDSKSLVDCPPVTSDNLSRGDRNSFVSLLLLLLVCLSISVSMIFDSFSYLETERNTTV